MEIQVLSIAFNLVIIRNAQPNDDVQLPTGGYHPNPTIFLRNLASAEDATEVLSKNEARWSGEKP